MARHEEARSPRGDVFGLAFLVLAVAVTAETIMRKVFNQSLQGVDELGGYILALAGAMSFSVALVARAHIRIDIVHDHLPRGAALAVQLCWRASRSSRARSALLRMAWFAYDEIRRARRDRADAVGDAAEISAGAVGRGAGAVLVRVRRRGVQHRDAAAEGRHRASIDRSYGPRTAQEELEDELADMKVRGVTADVLPKRRSAMSMVAVGITGFVIMVGLMLIGLPIGAVMLLVGLAGGMMAFGLAFLNSAASVAWGTMSENGLTAIPLFVLLGEFLLRSGMADRMYTVFAVWLGRLPGGLLHTNIGCCALFAATSGSSVATAATIGTVALPSLKRYGYPMPDALGSLAAGGTLGIMIPPSINFIIYGSMTDTSAGKLFIAGIIPGLALAGLFMAVDLHHRDHAQGKGRDRSTCRAPSASGCCATWSSRSRCSAP